MRQLENKVAIVTGAAGGIGEAIARALAAAGAAVVVADINDAASKAVAESLRGGGGQAICQHTDVGSSADIERLVAAAVAHFGKLDILVNNAGIALPGAAADISEEDWTRTLNINLSSVWRGMKYAIPPMLNNGGGSIINISSTQSLLGFKGWAAYAAAKGGINALTQQAAVDYAAQNIRINAIAPGTVMTPLNEQIFAEMDDPQPLIDHWNSLHPLGRFAQPEEVAAAAVFLAGDGASFITGEVLRVDGGQVINGG